METKRSTGFLAWDGEEIFEGDTLETRMGTIGTAKEENGVWMFEETTTRPNPVKFTLEISRSLSFKEGHSVLRKK